MTNFPASLSKVGKTDAKMQEEKILGQLRRAVECLDKQSDAPDPEEIAQYIYGTYLTAKVAVTHKHKKGYASSASVAKQLRQIESSLATLEGRLAKADKNVFGALRDAAEDQEVAQEEWLQLRRLLLIMQERATRAGRAAEAVVKAFPQAKAKSGRPEDIVVGSITEVAGAAYKSWTGKRPNRSINRDTGEPEGEFHDFLAYIFQALGITASPNASNLRLQGTLKRGK